MNEEIKERLQQMKQFLKQQEIDYFIIPTMDYHNSEYVSDYFKVREYFSGFNGSNGTLLISQDKMGLWTDGRYFSQAEKQLHGTDIVLFRMGEENVPTISAYIEKEMKPSQTVAFYGKTMAASFGKAIEKIVDNKAGNIKYDISPAAYLWKDRPSIPTSKPWILDVKYAGKTYQEKVDQVRQQMKENQVTNLVLSKLDDIMWLFNLRGSDIACNPVFLSYALITMDESFIFMQKEAINEKIQKYLMNNKVQIYLYKDTYDFLEKRVVQGKIWMDMENMNYSLFKILENKGEFLNKENPIVHLKAVKNEVEQQAIKEIYLKDSVAVTKFIYQILKEIKEKKHTEVSAANLINELRKEIDGFLDYSFPTISAYAENAAIIHYEPGEKKVVLKNKGLLMVDSGGQYLKGTTDVTRTIALGEVSETEKKHYALVCTGMLNLQKAKFMYGATGKNLDILARLPLWEEGLDYRHGTGHGIGFVLNVHEGPQSIRWKYISDQAETVFEDGMLISDEPGIYVEGSHGIRIENILLCKTYKKSEYGKFLKFEPLTYVPLDSNLLDKRYLTEDSIQNINQYQKKVYEKISPFLNDTERSWLEKYTKEIPYCT